MNSFSEFDMESMGGVVEFNFSPIENIAIIPDAVNDCICTPITFTGANTFFQGKALRDSLNFSEKQKITNAGESFVTEITGMVPKLTGSYLYLFNEMKRHRFVLLVTDNNGSMRLCGTKEKGMRFSFDQDSKNSPGQLSGFQFSFTIETEKPSPFYNTSYTTLGSGAEVLIYDSNNTLLYTVAAPGIKIMADTKIYDANGNEIFSVKSEQPQTIPSSILYNTLNHIVAILLAGETLTGADITITKGDGSTIDWALGEDYTEDPNEGKVKAVFDPGDDLAITYIIESDDEGTFTDLTLDNCDTCEIQLNSVVQNFPTDPMTFATGDELIISITQTDPAAVSSVKISY